MRHTAEETFMNTDSCYTGIIIKKYVYEGRMDMDRPHMYILRYQYILISFAYCMRAPG